MKSLKVLAGALAVAVSATAMAGEGVFLGGTLGHYILDSERAVEGDFRSNVAGLQFGANVSETMSLELGYAVNVDHDEVDVLSLGALIWLGEEGSFTGPYATFGYAQYDFDSEVAGNLVPGHDDQSDQAYVGLGGATMLSDNLQFRGDIRYLRGLQGDSDGHDVGLNFSVNYLFGRAAPAPAPVVEEAPAPAPQPVAEPEKRTITVRLNVEFEFDKAIVRAIYGDQLEAIAAAMKAHDDIDLVLEGHTDSKGSDAYNQGLSDRRAKAVKAKLVEMYDIPADRGTAVGYGESRPIATNDTDEGRQRNRRVIGEMSYTEILD